MLKVKCSNIIILWPEDIQRENILLFVTDAAFYMIKVGKILKVLYSKCQHITCLVHALRIFIEKNQRQIPR